MRITIKRGCSQTITLPFLRNRADDVPVNDAVVKGTLLDGRGAAIPAFSNVPLSYVTASDGDYQWDIDGETMLLPIGDFYHVVLVAKAGVIDYRCQHNVTVEN